MTRIMLVRKKNGNKTINPAASIMTSIPDDQCVSLGSMSLTWLQVAELGQRPHLQMLQIKSVRLPAGQIPHYVFIDHTHTSKLHQSPKQQGDLRERKDGDHTDESVYKRHVEK